MLENQRKKASEKKNKGATPWRDLKVQSELQVAKEGDAKLECGCRLLQDFAKNYEMYWTIVRGNSLYKAGGDASLKNQKPFFAVAAVT